MRVALVTSRQHPDLIAEDQSLVEALRDSGVEPLPIVWDRETEWSGFDAALIRSTWDYTWRREEFLEWAERAGLKTRLFNPAAILRWSSHKRYLAELESRGVPIVPTRFIAAGEPLDLAALGRERGWDEVVVKPCVSAGARDTIRVPAATGQGAADALRPRGDLMIQPYQAEVERAGEHSLVFFDGQFSHAVRKHPMLVNVPQTGDPLPFTPDAEELETARMILSRLPEPLLYVRVDLVRDELGQPRLMELEALEPRLFFHLHSPAAGRLARALLDRLA